MILNEFDAYQEALKKINLNEEVMPIYKGRLLMENVDMYCKIQKILACNAFEKAHRWLYDLDIENLNELILYMETHPEVECYFYDSY